MRKLALIVVVLAGACGALLLGGQASGQTTGVTVEAVANDTKFLIQPGDQDPNTIVLAGSTVTFTHAAGPYPHNVDFTGGPQPASCTQADPPGGGAVPPMPAAPSGAAWSGTCTFATAGRYDFFCDLHTGMRGSITVLGGGGGPPPPPPPPPPPGAPPPPPPPPGAPPTGAAASLLRVTNPQRSLTLRGSIVVRSAKSRLLARAFARRGALSGGRSTVQVAVGRQLRASVGPGRVSFSVALSTTARRALRRNGRLAITLRMTVDPISGATYTA